MVRLYERIKAKGINDQKLAHRLASLACFPEGSYTGRMRYIFFGKKREIEETIAVYHKNTIDQIRDPMLVMLHAPDIQVTPMNGNGFKSADEFKVEFNGKYVEPNVIGILEEELNAKKEKQKSYWFNQFCEKVASLF